MANRLLDRASTPAASPPAQTLDRPDRALDALRLLTELRDQLRDALAARRTGLWKVPSVFFFDRRRQAELELAQPRALAEPFADLAASIAATLPELFASVEVRRVARAIDGLRFAAEELAADCPHARDLADLLAIPDDEVFTVLYPEQRTGFRLITRGIADVGQFHVLMEDVVTGDIAGGSLPGPSIPARFVAAYRDVNPATAAGVPMVAGARHQLSTPSVLRRDGSVLDRFAGCEHWLWPAMPLAAVPRVDGERVIVMSAPAFTLTWDITRRFPALAAEVQLLETLSPFRVGERLSRLIGREIPPQPARVPSKVA
jgi:hypothetical protein